VLIYTDHRSLRFDDIQLESRSTDATSEWRIVIFGVVSFYWATAKNI